MATIKFSEFPAGNISIPGTQIVGLDSGGQNAIFTASDLIGDFATVSYVDAQDTILQNQITANSNDIAGVTGNISILQSSVTTLQGQVTVLDGNIVVLESAVAALENNVTINQDDITVIQGNIVAIENELANIADTDAQTLSWDGVTANLAISNGNNVVLQEVLDNAGNITVMQGQIADLQANGNIQTLSLDNSSNVLSISGGNTVDFTTVLGNVVGSDAQTLSWDTANANLSISGGNTVTLDGLGGDSNIAVATASDGQQYLTTFDTDFFITADPNSTDTAYIAMGEAFNTNWNAGAYVLDGSGQARTLFNSKTITNKISSNGPWIALAAANEFYLGTRYNSIYTDSTDHLNLSAQATGRINLSIDGTDMLVVNGNTNNVEITADVDVTGNIIPSANITYDLGTSTNRWKDLYLSDSTIYLGNVEVSTTGGTLSVNSMPIAGPNTNTQYANLAVSNIYDVDGTIGLTSSIIPTTNAQYDLGSAEFKIRHLYLSDNSLFVGNLGISAAGNVMTTTGGTSYSVSEPAGGSPIDLTKTVHVLEEGAYNLEDGAEGQIIYLIPATGVTEDSNFEVQVNITVSNLKRINVSGSNVFTVYNNVTWQPFTYGEGFVGSSTQMIFAQGAWNYTILG